ncbi:MAG: hypothetical protein ACREJO_12020 [Phycisphaerales bacterium]
MTGRSLIWTLGIAAVLSLAMTMAFPLLLALVLPDHNFESESPRRFSSTAEGRIVLTVHTESWFSQQDVFGVLSATASEANRDLINSIRRPDDTNGGIESAREISRQLQLDLDADVSCLRSRVLYGFPFHSHRALFDWSSGEFCKDGEWRPAVASTVALPEWARFRIVTSGDWASRPRGVPFHIRPTALALNVAFWFCLFAGMLVGWKMRLQRRTPHHSGA